jgi:uncharacterized protein
MRLQPDLHIRVALGFSERAIGFIGRKQISPSEAMLFPNCSSVHTFGMKTPLDLVFLDTTGRVLVLYEAVPVWRVRYHKQGSAVLELAPMTARSRGFAPGFQFHFVVDSNGKIRGVL